MKKKITISALTISMALSGQSFVKANELTSGFVWIARSVQDVMNSVLESKNNNLNYVVQWGDTLASIAQVLDMSVLELAALNQIDNPDLIIAGSVISIDRNKHTVTINDETYSSMTGQEVEDQTEEDLLAIEPALIAESSKARELINAEDLMIKDWLEVETTEITPIIEFPMIEETSFDYGSNLEVVEESISEIQVEEETTTETTIETTTTFEENLEESSQEDYSEVSLESTEASVEETYSEEIIETTESTMEETTSEEVDQPTSTTGLSALEAFDLICENYGVSATEKEQWSYIINRESGFNPTISNPYSGAYGLPQALPGSKMASHGADWATNPYTQLAWMYDYMVSRYGSISGAYSFWQANHWY